MKTLKRLSGILLIAAVLLVSGCTSTVTPKAVKESQASFDGNAQNSGFLGWTNHFGVITAHAHERYQQLIATYGNRFEPKLAGDAGTTAFTNGTYLIDKEHLVDFGEMELWKRSGAK